MQSDAGPAQYAALLSSRPSCSSAREDAGGPRLLKHWMVKQDAGPRANPPIFLRMPIRPVKVVIGRNTTGTIARMPLVYVPIWKCATSSMGLQMVPQLFNCGQSDRQSDRQGTGSTASCHRGPHDRYRFDSDVRIAASTPENGAENASIVRFYTGPQSAGSEAATAWRSGAVTITVVRDPLSRFISGWNPRKALEVCHRVTGANGRSFLRVVPTDKLGDSKRNEKSRRESVGSYEPCPSTLHSLEAHAHNISTNPAAFTWWRNGWVHWMSQTYFLSATDATGTRLHFDFVARLEKLDSDWAVIAAHVSGRAGTSKTAPKAQRSNANHGGTVALYADALRRSPSICIICGIFAQDYACLGYEKPKECARCMDQPPVQRPTICDGSAWRCRFRDFTSMPRFDDTVQSRVWACEKAPKRLTNGRLIYNHSACRSVNGYLTVQSSTIDRAWKEKAKAILGEAFPFEWSDGIPRSTADR